MDDEQLRELERRWRSTGAVGDEAAWLNAALRAGRLSAEQVELAALFGHPAAALVLERSVSPSESLESLTERLMEHGEWGFRAACLLTSTVLVRHVDALVREDPGVSRAITDDLASTLSEVAAWALKTRDALPPRDRVTAHATRSIASGSPRWRDCIWAVRHLIEAVFSSGVAGESTPELRTHYLGGLAMWNTVPWPPRETLAETGARLVRT